MIRSLIEHPNDPTLRAIERALRPSTTFSPAQQLHAPVNAAAPGHQVEQQQPQQEELSTQEVLALANQQIIHLNIAIQCGNALQRVINYSETKNQTADGLEKLKPLKGNKGVRIDSNSSGKTRYVAVFEHNLYGDIYLGTFTSASEAAKAYDEARHAVSHNPPAQPN